MYVSYSTAFSVINLEESVFDRNSATVDGGAIYM
jgi:predicted outer membrane repeat protein